MIKENFKQPPQEDPETEEVKGPDFDIENEAEKTRAEEFEERKPEVLEKINEEVDGLSDEEVKDELEKKGLPVDMRSKRKNREQLKQVRLGRAETMAGLRDKLNEFKQSRQRFVEAENNLKKYEGLIGSFKMAGDMEADTKENVQEEYDQALAEYEEKRAEYVGEKVNRVLNQQTELVKTRAENFDQEKGFGKKFYEGYKKLGKWNLGALLGDEFMKKLDRKEDDGKVKRFFKGTARFFTKTLSVRMGLSMGLLGAGFVLGGGVGFVGALAARRVLAGFGTGFGAYDLMKMFGARKEIKKGMRKELSKEELETIELSEITDRMSHFEQEAEASGDANVLDNKTYIALKIEFNSRTKETKAEKTRTKRRKRIQELIEHADKNLEKVKGEARKKELKRRGIAAGVGLFVGSGALGEALGAGKTFIADLIKGDEAMGEVAEQLSGTGPEASNVAVEQELLREVQEFVLPIPEDLSESAQETYNHLKDIINGVEGKPGPTIIRAQAMAVGEQLKTAAPEQWEEILQEYKGEGTDETDISELVEQRDKIAKGLTGQADQSVVEQLDYQGGDSVWNEVKNQLQARTGFKELFTPGDEAEQTHAIDYFENKIVANPEEYGLEKGVDFTKLSAEDLKNINWDKLLSVEEGEVDKVFPGSTEAVEAAADVDQIESIISEPLLTPEEFANKLKEMHPEIKTEFAETFKVDESGIITREDYTGTFTLEDNGDFIYSGGTGQGAEISPKILKSGINKWEDYTPSPTEPLIDPLETARGIQEFALPIPEDLSESAQETYNHLKNIINGVEGKPGPTIIRAQAMDVAEQLKTAAPEQWEEILQEYKGEGTDETDISELVEQRDKIAKGLTEQADQSVVSEQLDYQGGNTVWNEVENQLQGRTGLKDLFTGGDEAEQTHALDYFKDKIVANPQEYGLAEGVDADKLTPEQLKSIDWNKLLSIKEGEIDKVFPNLTEEAKQNIIENNRILQEYVSKTGEALDTDTVDQVLEDVKKAGGVDEYLKPGPEQVISEQPVRLSEMNPGEMTNEEQVLFENYEKYLETDVRGSAAKAAQEAAEKFLDNQSPEVYNKYSDVKEAIQNIRIDDLNEELNEGKGLLRFGRPDTDDLMTGVQRLAETHDFSETETKLFSNWLAGEGGILKKNDFADLMTGRELDPVKFSEQIQDFNDAINSKDLPDTYAWEPRHIYTGEGVEKTEQLVNIREVEGGYQIDSTGDGMPDQDVVHKELTVKQMMIKEVIKTAKA